MTLREENRNLLDVPQGYYLAHCITGDFSLGAGVAKKIDYIFNMKEKLHRFFTPGAKYYLGDALLVDNVFNLVIKKDPTKKAKYKRLRATLEDMKDQMTENLITKVAMPKLGCGHENMDWDRAKEIIKEVFADTDVEILVCDLIKNKHMNKPECRPMLLSVKKDNDDYEWGVELL